MLAANLAATTSGPALYIPALVVAVVLACAAVALVVSALNARRVAVPDQAAADERDRRALIRGRTVG